MSKKTLKTKNWVEALFYIVILLKTEIKKDKETVCSWLFSLYELLQLSHKKGNAVEALPLLKALFSEAITPEEIAIYLFSIQANGYVEEDDFINIFFREATNQTEEENRIVSFACKMIVDYICGISQNEDVGNTYPPIIQ